MSITKREHTLGIWALTLGYFLFYVPYSGLVKAATSGLLAGGRRIPGAELLPSAVISTAMAVLLFITVMRWWKYGDKRQLLGLNVLLPRRHTFISGIGFSIIVITTTLAYSFSGISIVFALILMRAGVLIMSPLIDHLFHRRVRWFSWVGLMLSLLSLLLSFSSIHEYQLGMATLLNLAAYLIGYALRIPCMTHIAKTGEKETAFRYFVEEQAVAMPLIILAPAVLALTGRGEIVNQLRFGFAHLLDISFILPGFGIGIFYAGLGIVLSFIYMDRRENTFCMPLFSCSSLLSGIVASYILMWWLHGPTPSGVQIGAALLIIAALLVMSPLHHLPLYLKNLKGAIMERRLVIVDFSGTSPTGSQRLQPEGRLSFITINFAAVRQILQKGPHTGGRS